eukprot:TRINITY_DN3546_c0_g1_i1.p1 TRINITY_DN3546_c0_g1~~TRINITY_DN3546_c0_g1_i1.p1  ORF type:complete len:111 (+),score=20.24 TRINITY_DN3546_c0_g1_i1:82-414(+)
MFLDYLLGFGGIMLLVVGALDTIQYREQLKIAEEDFYLPPAKVLLCVVGASVACTVAALRLCGEFLPVRADAPENRTVKLPELVDFMTFNHRGKILPAVLGVNFSPKRRE